MARWITYYNIEGISRGDCRTMIRIHEVLMKSQNNEGEQISPHFHEREEGRLKNLQTYHFGIYSGQDLQTDCHAAYWLGITILFIALELQK